MSEFNYTDCSEKTTKELQDLLSDYLLEIDADLADSFNGKLDHPILNSVDEDFKKEVGNIVAELERRGVKLGGSSELSEKEEVKIEAPKGKSSSLSGARRNYEDVTPFERLYATVTDERKRAVLRHIGKLESVDPSLLHGIAESLVEMVKTNVTWRPLRTDVTVEDIMASGAHKEIDYVHSIRFMAEFHAQIKGMKTYTTTGLVITRPRDAAKVVRGIPINQQSADILEDMVNTTSKRYIFPIDQEANKVLGQFFRLLSPTGKDVGSHPEYKAVIGPRKDINNLAIECANAYATILDKYGAATKSKIMLINRVQHMLLTNTTLRDKLLSVYREVLNAEKIRIDRDAKAKKDPFICDRPKNDAEFKTTLKKLSDTQGARNRGLGEIIYHRLMNSFNQCPYDAARIQLYKAFAQSGHSSPDSLLAVLGVVSPLLTEFGACQSALAATVTKDGLDTEFKDSYDVFLADAGKIQLPNLGAGVPQLVAALDHFSGMEVGFKLHAFSNAKLFTECMVSVADSFKGWKLVGVVKSGNLHTPDFIATFVRDGDASAYNEFTSRMCNLVAISASANAYFEHVRKLGLISESVDLGQIGIRVKDKVLYCKPGKNMNYTWFTEEIKISDRGSAVAIAGPDEGDLVFGAADDAFDEI